MSSVRTFFRHCPSCGRRFEIRLVGKNLEESSEISEKGRPLSVGSPVAPASLHEGAPAVLDVEEFRYTYRCEHCGHQWSELRETSRAVGAPSGYTGD